MSLICRCSQMLSAGKKLSLKSLKNSNELDHLDEKLGEWKTMEAMERGIHRVFHILRYFECGQESPRIRCCILLYTARNWEMRNPLTQRWNDKNFEKGGTVAAFQNLSSSWRVRRTKKEELWRCFRRHTWCTWFDQHNSKYIREIARWPIHNSKYIRSHLREAATCTVLALDLQSSARWCWLGSAKLSLQTSIKSVSLLPFVSAATRCYFLLCCDRAERPVSVGAHSRVSTQYFGPKKPSN